MRNNLSFGVRQADSLKERQFLDLPYHFFAYSNLIRHTHPFRMKLPLYHSISLKRNCCKYRISKTSRKFLDCTIIAYSFLRNGYNYYLANVFRKMGIAYKNGTVFREIPMKEEYGLSMLLASGFLQGCAAKHESGR